MNDETRPVDSWATAARFVVGELENLRNDVRMIREKLEALDVRRDVVVMEKEVERLREQVDVLRSAYWKGLGIITAVQACIAIAVYFMEHVNK